MVAEGCRQWEWKRRKEGETVGREESVSFTRFSLQLSIYQHPWMLFSTTDTFVSNVLLGAQRRQFYWLIAERLCLACQGYVPLPSTMPGMQRAIESLYESTIIVSHFFPHHRSRRS